MSDHLLSMHSSSNRASRAGALPRSISLHILSFVQLIPCDHSRERVCCLLVLNLVTSPPRWILQPELRAMHGVCVFFFPLFLEAVTSAAGCHAPVFSGTSAFSLRLWPSRLTPEATSVLTVSSTRPPLPLLALRARQFHLPPPPRILLYTPYVIT